MERNWVNSSVDLVQWMIQIAQLIFAFGKASHLSSSLFTFFDMVFYLLSHICNDEKLSK